MRNAGLGARLGRARFHDDERLVQNQSPASGSLESLPVAGILQVSQNKADLRVLQEVLQGISKTQHALVAGGDPVTKPQAPLPRRPQNIGTQGPALAHEGRRTRLGKSTVEPHAKTGTYPPELED